MSPDPEPWETDAEMHAIADMPIEQVTELAAEKLLLCSHCDRQNDRVPGDTRGEISPEGIQLQVRFECAYCGKQNDHTAVFE